MRGIGKFSLKKKKKRSEGKHSSVPQHKYTWKGKNSDLICTLCRVKQPTMNNGRYFSNKIRKTLLPIKREKHRGRWGTIKWGQLQEKSFLIHLLRVDPWLCFISSAGLNDPLRLLSALYPTVWALFWWHRSCNLKKWTFPPKKWVFWQWQSPNKGISDPAGKGTSKRWDKNREGCRNSKRMSGDLGKTATRFSWRWNLGTSS